MVHARTLRFGSADWPQNLCFANGDAPRSIDFITLRAMPIPADWGSSTGAKRASEGTENLAMLMGLVSVNATMSGKVLRNLITENLTEPRGPVDTVPAPKLSKRTTPASRRDSYDYCGESGEYSTAFGQIPVSRLVDMTLCKTIDIPDKESKTTLEHMITLLNPASSPWNCPLIRTVSNHTYNETTLELTVQFYVYFTRLIFELISDPDVMYVMNHLEKKPFKVIPVYKRPEQPVLFRSTPLESSSRYTLNGLLKQSESKGYNFKKVQPKGISLKLYDFQLSTCQWMLDQEMLPRGLNGLFWEKWESEDVGSFYYFPLAGEIRFTAPPHATGGLLCEEMGLGKTIEVMTLMVSNPRTDISTGQIYSLPSNPNIPGNLPSVTKKSTKVDRDMYVTRATLIVVPSTLVGQWSRELQNCIVRSELPNKKFDVLNVSNRQLKDVLTISYEDLVTPFECAQKGQMVQFTIPWGPVDKIYEGIVISVKNPYDDITCCEISVEIDDYESFLSDNDVVLTDYNNLTRNKSVFSNIHWHRIVLDECQEIKVATNKIASLCSKLQANHRWMVSGTPLCTKIADLHGELNFLQVWPFCLSDSKDGFWETKIGVPFEKKDAGSLYLLYSLMDSVMMRHSKTQTYLDGRSLVSIPSRTIEWRSIDITNDSEKYIFQFLSTLAADACGKFLSTEHGFQADRRIGSLPHFSIIKSLLGLMSRCLTSPKTLILKKLDHIKRLLVDIRLNSASNGMLGRGGEVKGDVVPLMSAEQVLFALQQVGQGANGGLNRDTNRVHASVYMQQVEEESRNKYSDLSMPALRELVVAADLPMPITWYSMPFRVDVRRGASTLLCHYIKEDETASNIMNTDAKSGKKLSKIGQKISCNDVLRVHWVDKEEAEVVVKDTVDYSTPQATLRLSDILTVEDDDEVTLQKRGRGIKSLPSTSTSSSSSASTSLISVCGEISVSNQWNLSTQLSSKIFKKDKSSRKQPYVDLLVAKEFALKGASQQGGSSSGSSNSSGGSSSSGGGRGGGGGVGMHEGGFATLYRLMAGEQVGCPLCLEQAVRPTVTRCVHVHCYVCIMDVIDREKDRGPKCPVCRRAITEDSLIEVCTDTFSSGFDENDVNGAEEAQIEIDDQGIMEEHSSNSSAKLGTDKGNGIDAKHLVVLDSIDREELVADYRSVLSKRKRKKTSEYEDNHDDDMHDSSSSSSSSSSSKGYGHGKGTKKNQIERNNSMSSISAHDDTSSNNIEHSIKMDTTDFIFSDMNLHTSAPTNSDLASIPPPHRLILRNPEYPSLDSIFLSHLEIILREDFISSRMIAVLSDIIEVRKTEPAAKFLIFSQYSDSLKEGMAMLNDMNSTHENILEGNLFDCVIVDGKDSPESREKSLKRFMEDEKCNICFLTLNAAAAGLTLTVAHVCYLLEPTHSAADEAQALNRVHRIGQGHSVRCVIFYAKNSCEERLLALRHLQGQLTETLSATSSSGSSSRSSSGVTDSDKCQDDPSYSTSSSSSSSSTSSSSILNKPPTSRSMTGVGTEGFFSANNLKLIFGVSEERDAIKAAEAAAAQEALGRTERRPRPP